MIIHMCMKAFQALERQNSHALCQPWERREALWCKTIGLNLMPQKQRTNYWGCCLPKQQ